MFFAALTSSVSLVETIVAVLRENGALKRWKACLIVFGVTLVLGSLSSLGYGPLAVIHIGNEAEGNAKYLLDMFDWFSNSVLMPLVAIGTCIIAGFFADTNSIMDEIGLKKKISRRYFRIMIRYVAPVCMGAILVSGFLPL